MATTDKPIFKASTPPLKLPEDAKAAIVAATGIDPKTDLVPRWAPIETAPQDADARFMVRTTVLSKDGLAHLPVSGTETIVRYRMSRKRIGHKWQPSLAIIDDRLGTKLGFRPTEWKPLEKKTDA